MQPQKDRILEKINKIVHEKRLKTENVSKAIGISKGEFSKILSGKRKEYFKHLPKIAEILGMSFTQLVSHDSFLENSFEYQNDSQILKICALYERLININDLKDEAKDQLILQLQEALKKEANYKEIYLCKYSKLKTRLISLESELISIRNKT